MVSFLTLLDFKPVVIHASSTVGAFYEQSETKPEQNE